MSFTQIISFRVSDNGAFKKDISVVSFKDNFSDRQFKYIDLRLKVLISNEEIFTRKGVTLTVEDLNNLLPIWLTGCDHEHNYVSQLDPQSYRTVTFKKNGPLFQLYVKKCTYFGEKLQMVYLSMEELIEISKVKDEILLHCGVLDS